MSDSDPGAGNLCGFYCTAWQGMDANYILGFGFKNTPLFVTFN